MDNCQDENIGLSRGNIQFLVAIFVIALLIWGPIEPYGIIIRITYLVILPVLLWFILNRFGSLWRADKFANIRLTRWVIGIIAGIFFVMAYFAFTADYHTECTETISTGDGSECIGEYISVKGPDAYNGRWFLVFGGIATWVAVKFNSYNDED